MNPGAGSGRVTVGEYSLGSATLYGMKRPLETAGRPLSRHPGDRCPRTAGEPDCGRRRGADRGADRLVAVAHPPRTSAGARLALGRRWCSPASSTSRCSSRGSGRPARGQPAAAIRERDRLWVFPAGSVAYLAGWTTLVRSSAVSSPDSHSSPPDRLLRRLYRFQDRPARSPGTRSCACPRPPAAPESPPTGPRRPSRTRSQSTASPQSSTTRQPSGSATVMLRPSQYGFSGSTSR